MTHSSNAPISIKQGYDDKEVEYVRKDTIPALPKIEKDPKYGYFPVGQQILIRTVTAIDVGLLIDVTDHELIIANASWIADTGRWADFLSGEIQANEVEPFPSGNIVGVSRGAIVDWTAYNGDVSKQK